MDTSNSYNALHLRVIELTRSPHPENADQAKKCESILKQIMETLTPVLRYVCVIRDFGEQPIPDRVRCLSVGKLEKGLRQPTPDHVVNDLSECCAPREIFINENGKFFSVGEDGRIMHNTCVGVGETLKQGNDDWKFVMFDELVITLQTTFRTAIKKKEEHLEALRQRAKILDDIIAVMKS